MRLLFILTLFSFGIQPTQSSLRQQLSGKWNMVGVRIYEQDASSQLNPAGDRWLSFATAGTFSSGSGEQQENAGTFKLDETTTLLSLDSDAGPGDDSDWKVTIRNDTLFMRGVGTERQESSEVVLVR
ncbi:MAG: hypothetical protein AAF597_00280 [Bacteroidota bacterium]